MYTNLRHDLARVLGDIGLHGHRCAACLHALGLSRPSHTGKTLICCNSVDVYVSRQA